MTSASPRHPFNLELKVPEEASGQKKWESVLFSTHLLYFKFLVIFGQKLTTNSSRLVASLLVCGIELRSGDSTSHLRGLLAGLIYIYLGLVSYRLTIKERNGGVGIRGKNRVVDESTSCVSNVNCKSFCDGETKLL